jgi:uncharacterized protein YcfJ
MVIPTSFLLLHVLEIAKLYCVTVCPADCQVPASVCTKDTEDLPQAALVGAVVGAEVGALVGVVVGAEVGAVVGALVADMVGEAVGAVVEVDGAVVGEEDAVVAEILYRHKGNSIDPDKSCRGSNIGLNYKTSYLCGQGHSE